MAHEVRPKHQKAVMNWEQAQVHPVQQLKALQQHEDYDCLNEQLQHLGGQVHDVWLMKMNHLLQALVPGCSAVLA
jgi:hypothetical protein